MPAPSFHIRSHNSTTHYRKDKHLTYLPNISHDLHDPDNTTSTEFAKIRSDLLVKFTGLGVESIEIQYLADDVTAWLEDIAILPSTVAVPQDEKVCIGAFALQFTYSIIEGVKGEHGSRGSLNWDVLKNKIDIHHDSFYVMAARESHQGL